MEYLKLLISPLFKALAVFFGIKYVENTGKVKERLKNAEEFNDTAKEAREIQDNLDRVDRDDLDNFLQK